MLGIVFFVVIATSIWVLFDANSIGVKKGVIKGVGDMGKWGWFFSCLGMWVFAFPYYLAKRQQYKETISRTSSARISEPYERRDFCPNCGRRISPRFCGGCGQQV